MPFKSEKQRKYLWAKKPSVAREFAEKEKKSSRPKKKVGRRTRRKK
jgi:hypothetical protein